ncbi:hypothetical protein EV356DRAFT_41876 [Viridothelium virens]|uniref:Zn(2)-C6 fungal-type domain-containing protein n=1 Tax=Viridothelium virens TaxID=1048519 RepID=A0A6A6HHK7_VIRVR|nr:hypothetical protein EV356DRAFT_41876 [Viridothelium virens]
MSDSGRRTAIACSRCAKAKVRCDKKVPCTRCKLKRVHCESRPTRRYAAGQPVIYDTSNGFASHTFNAKPVALHLDTNPDQAVWGTFTTGQSDNQISAESNWLSSPIEKEPSSGKSNASHLHTPTSLSGIEPNVSQQDMKQSPEFVTSPDGIEYIVPMDNVHYHPEQTDYFMSRSNPYIMPSTTLAMASHMNGIGDFDDLGFQPPLFDPKASSTQFPAPSRPNVPTVKHPVLEDEAILNAQDHWSWFKCNPSPAESSPETTSAHLDSLVGTLVNQDAWDSLDVQQAESDLAMSKAISTEPVLRSVRDRLLEYTRELFRGAMERRIPSLQVQSPIDELTSIFDQAEKLILPPPHVLRYFLRAYVCGFEPFYPTVARGTLNPGVLLDEKSNHSPLLLLLLFAQGAMTNPTFEARAFSSGLTELCRTALNQAMQREIFVIRVDSSFMRNALHYLNLAAWGGDKWHMDVAIKQRAIYTSMLQLSGMLEQKNNVITSSEGSWDTEKLWSAWTEQESHSRLVYSWVNVDQEISLFHDTTPQLSVWDMHLAMPSADSLWKAASANDWRSLFDASGSMAQTAGLSDLFQQFMEHRLIDQAQDLSGMHLRLLLQPLQGLCSHLGQYLEFFPDNPPITSSRLATTSASRSQLNDGRYLLQQWFNLYQNSSLVSSKDPAVSTALIMYHLISLSTFVNFPEIEKVLQQSPLSQPFRHHFNLRMRTMESAVDIFFHCGQVLRLLCLLRSGSRPIWWPAAIYRVALICFITSSARLGMQFSSPNSAPIRDEEGFSINTLPPEDDAIVRFLAAREGTPMITKRNGELATLDLPESALNHCIDVLDEDLGTRLAEGIRNRLVRLVHRWVSPVPQAEGPVMYPYESGNLAFC